MIGFNTDALDTLVKKIEETSRANAKRVKTLTPTERGLEILSALLEEGRITAQVPEVYIGGAGDEQDVFRSLWDQGLIQFRHYNYPKDDPCPTPASCRKGHLCQLSEKGLTVHGDKLWDIFQVANKGIKRFPPDITRDEWNTAMLYEIQVGVTWGMFYTKNHGGKYWETRWEQYKKRK